MAITTGMCESTIHTVFEQTAVCESSKGIMICEIDDLLFSLLALGNIL